MKFLLPLLVLLVSFQSNAGTVSRLTTFEPNTKAQADEVNAEFDNIISTINGGIDSTNITDGSIATADVAASAITAVKIASYTITQVKMGSVGQQLSSLVSNTSVVGLSTANIATVTLSTYGRPVFVGLVPSSTASSDTSQIIISRTTAELNTGTLAVGNILLTRDTQAGTSTHITRWLPSTFAAATQDTANPTANTLRAGFPPGGFWTIDPVGAGTWTYVIRGSGNNSGTTIQFSNLKLIALEL